MYHSTLNIKHKHNTHLYWGIDKTTGNCVRIGEVMKRGLNCNCKCAACGGDFIARKGEVNKHHFAHQSNYECVYANEIAVYLVVKSILEQSNILLPAISVSIGGLNENIRQAWSSKVMEVFYHCDAEQYPPLMVGQVDGRPIRIVLQFGIYYTDEDYKQFRSEAIRNNWDCLIVNLPEITDENSLNRNAILEAIERDSQKQWVHNSIKAEWDHRIRRAAVTPPQAQKAHWEELYECPIHAHWRNGQPIADVDDCWHCEFNRGVSPKCLCLAQEFIQSLSDFELTAHERHRRRDALKAENDQKHEQAVREQEQREKLRSFRQQVQYYAPPKKPQRTACIALTYEEQLRLGKLEIQAKFNEPTDDLIYDSFKRRWLKCLVCGEIKPEGEMSIYGGKDGMNNGTCRDCCRK